MNTDKLTYYCPRGCNVFETHIEDPECAACGSIMTTDSDGFEDVHERIELDAIAAYEAVAAIKFFIGESDDPAIVKIAKLNDLCRKSMGLACRVVQTAGISSMSRRDQLTVLEKVKKFKEFTEDNDPHGEHDFGSFDHDGTKIFWKIDYYDPTMTYPSEDKADPKKTVRVLTIMLASEY